MTKPGHAPGFFGGLGVKADSRREAKASDAAPCTDVRCSSYGYKPDKTKPGFAKGLWLKIFKGMDRLFLIYSFKS
ncbi:hypothetical protein N6L24_03870 [Cognatishimia sp. SS12]|nr:hypothetical protein [Cognatishimia sp. SS12]